MIGNKQVKKVINWQCSWLYLLSLACFVTSYAYADEVGDKVTSITALNTPISNPGMGVETFHDGWGTVLTLEQYPVSGMGYYRYYWSELEPSEGEYNFSLIDDLLEQNAKQSKRVALRFMTLDEPFSGTKIPQWLIDKGIEGQWVENGKTFVADLDDPTYLYYVEKLLSAFGQRYDNDSRLAQIDIGMVGSWGEWHNSNFPELEPLFSRYSEHQLNKFVDLHFSAFPNTAKLMLINGGDSFAYALEKGVGWRADCWGDWHNFGATWSHMNDDYPYRIQQANSQTPIFDTAWQRQPVSFEVCGDMHGWLATQHYTRAQVAASLDWAINQHASSLNLKSKPIPEQYRDLLDNALLKIGYRFRVDTIRHSAYLSMGKNLSLEAHIFNDGVAPTYQPYYAYYRLVNSNDQVVSFAKDSTSSEAWLPVDYKSIANFSLPTDLNVGHYYIEIAVSESRDSKPLNLANIGKQPDGWYRLSEVIIEE
ncbi:Beta-galactosidase-like protein [Vibrio crassostreae]|nr:DUF4832 domain-containing protein [Vibrio crassostreae]CAK2418666.1 Beta-galactosidase-like protein [Vibrio crassostreae]CAK2531445.1 Beta-galactosidase-like protein [Vibrio crassostreae]CAK3113237.1 Beta-galactosidase-like protein [Vibrio crassostreae]